MWDEGYEMIERTHKFGWSSSEMERAEEKEGCRQMWNMVVY